MINKKRIHVYRTSGDLSSLGEDALEVGVGLTIVLEDVGKVAALLEADVQCLAQYEGVVVVSVHHHSDVRPPELGKHRAEYLQ